MSAARKKKVGRKAKDDAMVQVNIRMPPEMYAQLLLQAGGESVGRVVRDAVRVYLAPLKGLPASTL